jgi:hypothetical protein
LAICRLDAISTFTVDRYKRRRLDAGATNGTINLELATLSHLLNCATEWGWLKSRPCKIRLLEKTQGRIIALTHEQAESLLKAAIADNDSQIWLFVAFGLNTAMRARFCEPALIIWISKEIAFSSQMQKAVDGSSRSHRNSVRSCAMNFRAEGTGISGSFPHPV